MITIKHNLILGWIRRFITTVFMGLYKIIAFLNFQLPVLVGAVGLILFLTGALKSDVMKYLYLGALGLSVIIAFAITIKKISRRFTRNKKPVTKEKVKSQPTTNNPPSKLFVRENDDDFQSENFLDNNTSFEEEKPVQSEKPRFYAVKGRENYYCAEYVDRYELYYKENGKLKKIRVDYKRDNV